MARAMAEQVAPEEALGRLPQRGLQVGPVEVPAVVDPSGDTMLRRGRPLDRLADASVAVNSSQTAMTSDHAGDTGDPRRPADQPPPACAGSRRRPSVRTDPVLPAAEEQLAELVADGVELRGCASSSGVRGRGRSTGMRATIRPGRGLITATTSARNTASAIEWVTSRVVVARSVQIRCSSRLRRWRVISSRAPNGSSSSRICGSTTRARAMATRWRMPPDSWAGRALVNCSRPTSEMRSRMADSGTLTPLISSGSRMLVRTDRHGSSAESWKAMPRWWLRRAAAGGSPWTSAVPLVGVSRSARMRRIVDLPHPDGPSRATKAPGRDGEVDVLQGDHRQRGRR